MYQEEDYQFLEGQLIDIGDHDIWGNPVCEMVVLVVKVWYHEEWGLMIDVFKDGQIHTFEVDCPEYDLIQRGGGKWGIFSYT